MPDPQHALREHVIYLLKGGGAHAAIDDAIRDFPPASRGIKVVGFPHTAWMLLEHVRLAQWDILEYSRNGAHVSPAWPKGYWPKSEAPPTEIAWDESVASFQEDLRAVEELVADPKTDLYAKIPWSDGHTILREVLLVADHNAYHVGQLVMLRRILGAWQG
jgi:hypothetical protein